MMVKFRITKKKGKRGGHYKTAGTKRLSFFLSIKSYVKRSDVAYKFRVQKYAHKGRFPLSLKFYIVYALVFDFLYERK